MNLPEKMRSLVEAYKRQKIEELMKNNDDLAEEIEMEEGNGKKWWNIPDESLSVEELKRKHQDMDIVVVAKQN
ncbi:BnaA01g33680D [Brassica napus]|uniref:BnaA01g33680D protein n=1 Tax=Brassica napus TaxID=3708 RepID=A0A078G7Y8_BRANA|nr:BnaA01g33680D [Brassica napus]